MATYTTKDGRRVTSSTNKDGTKTKNIVNTDGSRSSAIYDPKTRISTPTGSQLPAATSNPIESPTPVTQITPAPTLSLPEPTAVDTAASNLNTVQGTVDRAKENLNTVVGNQKTEVDTEISKLEKEQERILKDAQPLTQPFREKLETKERERLHINENFEANQKLTNELEGLLTEGNELINMAMGRQVSGKVLDKSLSKTIADVNARAGVIEAVMNARNGQIAQAERTIDRTVAAIVADRTDEINYYNTLLSMNDKKLVTLTDEKYKLAETLRNQAQKEVDNAQETADYIKNLMINPETASFMADAGVSLADSIDGIKTKMAKQSKIQEVVDMRNSLVAEGYELSPVPVPGGIEVEAGGQTLYAKVRPGSELALKLEASRASAAASWASARSTETSRLLDLAAAGDPAAIKALNLTMPNGNEPSDELLAYAAEYAASGKVATLPKHINLGQVAELAKTLPKPNGAIVSTNTGVMSTTLGETQKAGVVAMNEIVNDTLPFMMQKWEEAQRTNLGGTGVVGGIASKLIPSRAMTEYKQARDEFLNKLLVARSGAAVTEQEYARYSALVPDAFNSPFYLGSSGETKLNNLSNLMTSNFDNFLNSNQLSVYGYSQVPLGDEDYTVGEVITNEYGQSAIVQPDGSLVLVDL
jgi:hypothetical protein